MMAAPGADAGQVRQLLESARKLGLADVRVGAPAEAPDVAARNGTPVA
jgi:Holliday junction resolvase